MQFITTFIAQLGVVELIQKKKTIDKTFQFVCYQQEHTKVNTLNF